MTEWRCGCDTRNWPVTHSCKALTHSGSPQPFDSTNSRQTALIGSKVLCYLFGTVYVPLQLDLCCINKKSVKEVFCCTKNEHNATRTHICSWPSRVGSAGSDSNDQAIVGDCLAASHSSGLSRVRPVRSNRLDRGGRGSTRCRVPQPTACLDPL